LALVAASTREQREEYGRQLEDSDRAMKYLDPNPLVEVRSVTEQLKKEFLAQGLTWGAPVFLRQFKFKSFAAFLERQRRTKSAEEELLKCYRTDERGWRYRQPCDYMDKKSYLDVERNEPVNPVLEVWVKKGDRYVKFRSYKVCALSGTIGPKIVQGDDQSPEGVFRVSPKPFTAYYLALTVNYPSEFDVKTNPATRNRGGDVLIHGKCMSAGCTALSGQIPEVYSIVKASGAPAPFHVFPFPLSQENIDQAVAVPEFTKWKNFWQTLKAVHDDFEETDKLRTITVERSSAVPSFNGYRFKLSN